MSGKQRKLRAVADFVAETEEELSLKAGDLVISDNAATNGWMLVKSLRTPGAAGYVPESYLSDAREVPGGNLVQTGTSVKSSVNGTRKDVKDQYSYTALTEKFQKTLEFWRERERRFLAGEAEKLPEARRRVYFYWDEKGVRHGPVSESQMRAKFQNRQLAANTPVALATDEQALLKKVPVKEYFPQIEDAFQTVPVVKDEGLWWCYLDEFRAIQGPFPAEQMYTWFQEGYFNAETLVRLSTQSNDDFVPLGSLFHDGAGAFLSEGIESSQQNLNSPQGIPPAIAVEEKTSPLTLDFDPTFKPLEPIYHDDEFYTKPLAETVNQENVDLERPSNQAYYEQNTYLADINTTGGWQVERDPWAIDKPSHLDTIPAASTEEFDPYNATGSGGRNLFAEVIRQTSSDELTASNIGDFQIELDNPLEQQQRTKSQEDDPFNLDWLDEATGNEDLEVEVGAPEAEETKKEATPPPEAIRPPEAIPAPTKPAVNKPGKRNIASLAVIQKDHLKTVEALYTFLTRPLPKSLGIVQCRIKRITTGLHVRANRYQVFLEKVGKGVGPQIMRATKLRYGLRSHYSIAIGTAGNKEDGKVVAECIHNHIGTQFVLHNDVPQHRGKPRDLCCLTYTSNFEKEGGPRKMKAAIPAFKEGSQSELYEWPHARTTRPKDSAMLKSMLDLDFKKLLPLKNKSPKWNSAKRAWTLNFHGRVKKSSVKNFQLISPDDQEHVILQHGKVGLNDFIMDVQWPMSPVVAFAICLSSLHGKFAVE